MSDIIRLLPDSVANQIAAGEVIQRPASVVKELVENAVDAGATIISVILKDAGRTLIQVVDNGRGMTNTDARMAFERHSTSKITRADDLFSLRTMGFRGEALASIAAVATVELITMPHDETIGTKLVISGSKVELQEPTAAAPGSSMSVKNLFFNVPARRKFLKKDSVELSNILHEFERLALVNPDLELELYHNGTLVHKLIRGSLKQRISQLFGKSTERQLIPVDVSTPIIKITGFCGHPENARRRGALQYFFVNGRNMRHPYFHKAVMSCYEQLIASDVQPNYFLNFEVDPATIDVNIHPTKNEIKFENEQAIWQILTAAIRESLGKFNAAPAIDFNRDDAPDIPAFNPDATAFPVSVTDPAYNPFAETPRSSGKSSGGSFGGHHPSRLNGGDVFDFLDSNLRPSSTGDFQAPISGEGIEVTAESALNFGETMSVADESLKVMQVGDKFILSAVNTGLMVIDQHRAHLTVLYHRYVGLMKNNKIESQRVFFPEVLSLDASRSMILDSIIDNVRELGFEVNFLGDNSWAINAVPSTIADLNPVATVLSMIDDVMNETASRQSDVVAPVALSLARAAAIKSGQRLSRSEMESLLTDLLSLPSSTYTPDGRPVYTIMSLDALSSKL